ncbi:MAG: head-tail connector protein [Sphingobium sp.]
MAEPITLEQAKMQCRILADDEDALITSYIKAARQWVEEYTGHILVQREITETVEAFGGYVQISARPIVSVDSIAYVDSDGQSQPFTGYTANVGKAPLRIWPTGSWPTLGTNSYATVTYTAGYVAGEEPQPLLQAMLLLVGHFWSQRAAAGDMTNEIAMGVTALCDRYRPVFA